MMYTMLAGKKICLGSFTLVHSSQRSPTFYFISDFLFSKIWGEDLKDLVESRGEAGHVLTIRPDSGDPATVVCKLLNILSEKFGSTKNSKGYKVLPPYLRLLQVI